jgi:DNA-binding CsgD family transcriptional regulator
MTSGARPVRGQKLTDREVWFLQRMATGMTYAALARRMYVSEARARGIGHEIIVKLGAANMVHAVHIAGMSGIIGMNEYCGDRAAYIRHVRHGETADVKCRKAQAEYSRGRRKNKISGGDRVQPRDRD